MSSLAPTWNDYEHMFRGILDRQYYNNNGPLHEQLEASIAQILGVKHAICVINTTMAFLMLHDALGVKGRVIIPDIGGFTAAQVLRWRNAEPVFCPVDANTGLLDVNALDALVDERTSAVMGVNVWGAHCDVELLSQYCASQQLALIMDSSDVFSSGLSGCNTNSHVMAEVFTFDDRHCLNAADAACIATNNDALANYLLNMRPSYKPCASVPIVRVANARMSEAQAAVGLISIAQMGSKQMALKTLREQFDACLPTDMGIMSYPMPMDKPSHTDIVLRVDPARYAMTAHQLAQTLQAHHVDIHAVCSNSTRMVSATAPADTDWVRMPAAQLMHPNAVEPFCETLVQLGTNS